MSANITPASLKQASQLQSILDRIIRPHELKKNPLVEPELKFLIESVKKQLKANPRAMLEIEAPLIILGDTHGQYRDVLRMVDLNGWPPKEQYLFLGDYVDRGPRSVEVVAFIFAMKLAFPRKFWILRGNHEAKEINKHYGFYEEVTSRYSEQLWEDFNEVFTYMPLAALISDRLFCMHGGIPAKRMDPNFAELRQMSLPIESPRDNEIVADLLWSDPDGYDVDFPTNPRGLGHQFGLVQCKKFCERHDIDLIVRAHQVKKEGFDFFGDKLVTVFSAPNYGGEFENDAGMLVVNAELNVHARVIHPFHRR